MNDETPTAERRRGGVAATPFPALRVRAARDRMMQAVLELSGERGHARVRVDDVIERAGVSRSTFYRNFTDKEDCFSQAYGQVSEWVHARLLQRAKSEEGCRQGLRAALVEILEMCAERPAIAKAMIIDADAAGGRVVEQHNRLLERLGQELDEVRGGVPAADGPPLTTPAFTVGAIETMLRAKLLADEADRMPEVLPSALYVAMVQYFGERVAYQEMSSAPMGG